MKINLFKVSAKIALPFLLLAFVLIPGKAFAAVDTCTWTGALNGSTSNSANWTGCNGDLPEFGDSLVFPSTALTKFVQIDAPIEVVDVTFSGGVGNYSVTSNGSHFWVEIFNFVSSGNTINSAVVFNGSGSRSISSQAPGNSFINNIFLTSGVSTMNIDVTAGNRLTFSTGTITGFATNFLIGNSGSGIVKLDGANNFSTTNPVAINKMKVECGNATCLGNVANGILLSDEGTIDITSAVTVANPIETTVYTAGPVPTLYFSAAGTFSGPLTLGTDTNIGLGIGIAGRLTGNIDIGSGKTAIFTGNGNPASEDINQTGGVVSGGGNIRVSDVRLELRGANTYSGTTTINAGGYIENYTATGLGDTTGATTIENGGGMKSFGAITVAENITMSGNGATGFTAGALSGNPALTYSGTITLAGDTLIIAPSSGQTTMSGVITGTGNLEMRGPGIGTGSFTFGGASANTYVGTTTVSEMSLYLSKPASIIAIPGNLNIVATALKTANVEQSTDENIADTAIVTLNKNANNSSYLSIGGNGIETVGQIVGDGIVRLNSGGILKLASNSNYTFAGLIDQYNNALPQAKVIHLGSGTLTLTGTLTGTGTTFPKLVNSAGTLVLNGSYADAVVEIENTATLKGTGTAGATTIMSGGNISVGTSPGCMTLASLTMNAGSIFTQEIAGTVACTGYDQTTVVGAAALNGTLTPVVTFTTTSGNVFTIITAGSITGTFTGLADNATFVANGRTYRINYTATTVTLTDATTIIVSGGGGGGGGSYSMGGCRDALAINYERYATFQSGTCIYAQGVNSTSTTSTPTTSTPSTTTSSQSTTVVTGGSGSSIVELFNINLKLRSTGKDVKRLQQFLNAQGFTVSKVGIGSAGKESDYFGLATRAAVIKFQEKYTAEILTPNELTRGTGLFFASTRAQANKILQNK